MAQVWTMSGLGRHRGRRRPADADDADARRRPASPRCSAPTATRPTSATCGSASELSVTTALESVVGPKQTGVGEGYFVTTRNIWSSCGDEEVADDAVPGAQVQAPQEATHDRPVVIRPVIEPGHRVLLGGHRGRRAAASRSATPAGSCATRPARRARRATRSTAATSSRPARGTVFSFLVHHAPQMPGKELPSTIALVELEEGVRMVGEVVDVATPRTSRSAMPVRVDCDRIDDELTLPIWEASMKTLTPGSRSPRGSCR